MTTINDTTKNLSYDIVSRIITDLHLCQEFRESYYDIYANNPSSPIYTKLLSDLMSGLADSVELLLDQLSFIYPAEFVCYVSNNVSTPELTDAQKELSESYLDGSFTNSFRVSGSTIHAGY